MNTLNMPTPSSIEETEIQALVAHHIDRAHTLAEQSGCLNRSSARLCVEDAKTLASVKTYDYAILRAAKSLAYSVGKGHPFYLAAMDDHAKADAYISERRAAFIRNR